MNLIGKGLSLAAALVRGAVDPRRRLQLGKRLQEYHQEEAFFADLESRRPQASPAVGAEALGLDCGLLVSTSAGLFLLADGHWMRLLATAGYGVALDGDGTVFAVASPGNESYIVRARLQGSGAGTTLTDLHPLCRFETRYHGERLHQIVWSPELNAVVCANTRRNSVLTVDPAGGAFIDEIFVLTDRFGYPIRSDHNHVNGVATHHGAMLFSLHTLGDGGGLGFVAGGRVRVYAHPARGLHDVLLHDGGLMFTDSFRNARMASDPAISGAVVRHGAPYLSAAVDALPRQFVLRGLAGRNGAIYVGCSTYAKRDHRFDEAGGAVMVLRDGRVDVVVEGPFSQVYDVLPVDGIRMDRPLGPLDESALHEMFLRDVGACVYDQPLASDALVPALR